MITGRPKPALTLTADEHAQLRSFAASRTLPHAPVARAKLVLWSAAGQSNTQIARRLRWTNATVGKWRQRFVRHRLAGLYDELRPRRPARSTMTRSRRCSNARFSAHRPTARTGAFGKPPTPAASPGPPCIACFRLSACSRTGRVVLSCPPIRSLWKRCATWSACID